MKRPHLWAVDGPPGDYESLMRAASIQDLRVGWLRMAEEATPPAALADAASSGARRAVAVAPGWTVSAKRRKGEAVLDDLLREHFLGCRLVLIAGTPPPETPELPRLSRVNASSQGGAPDIASPDAALWRLASPHEASDSSASATLTTEDLLARLRRPTR